LVEANMHSETRVRSRYGWMIQAVLCNPAIFDQKVNSILPRCCGAIFLKSASFYGFITNTKWRQAIIENHGYSSFQTGRYCRKL